MMSASRRLLFPNKAALTYTSCYCEENVWKLCEVLHSQVESRGSNNNNTKEDMSTSSDNKNERSYALFISSPTERTPFWFQKSRPNGLVIWDYHVILVHSKSSDSVKSTSSVVYDLDTVLPFPCPLDEYVDRSMMTTLGIRQMIDSDSEDEDGSEKEENIKQYMDMFDAIRFRLVTSEQFFHNFSSDRSHMINKETEEWMATPPTYPCIKQHASDTMNLMKYRDMTVNSETEASVDIETAPFGKVMNMRELLQYFGYNYDNIAKKYK